MEPAKAILEKDRNALDSELVAEIDRTVKKHSENLLHVLEGVSARLTQLESRTRHLENSVDDLKISVGNNHGSTDEVMRQLENVLREVCYLYLLPFVLSLTIGLQFMFLDKGCDKTYASSIPTA